MTGAKPLSLHRREHHRQEFLETVQEELYRRIASQLAGDAALAPLLAGIDGRTAEPYGAAMELLGRKSDDILAL